MITYFFFVTADLRLLILPKPLFFGFISSSAIPSTGVDKSIISVLFRTYAKILRKLDFFNRQGAKSAKIS